MMSRRLRLALLTGLLLLAGWLGSAATASEVSLNRVRTVLIWPVRSTGFALRAKSGRIPSSFWMVAGLNSAIGMPNSLL